MCNILEKTKVQDKIVNSVSSLESRGYDSAAVDGVNTQKDPGQKQWSFG